MTMYVLVKRDKWVQKSRLFFFFFPTLFLVPSHGNARSLCTGLENALDVHMIQSWVVQRSNPKSNFCFLAGKSVAS